MNPSAGEAAPSDGRPPGLVWAYDRAELVADAVVHVLGVLLAGVGAAVLAALAAGVASRIEFASVLVYAIGLVTGLGLSATYNLWPVSRAKWVLRRFDHSAIYLLIASTYTPFITQMEGGPLPVALFAALWTAAIVGTALKLALPGRFDRLSIGLYVLMGWSGVVAYDAVGALPASTLRLLAVGGVLYTGGIVFHLWERLRFQNAIWHGIVLAAATCHYAAVLDCMVLRRW